MNYYRKVPSEDQISRIVPKIITGGVIPKQESECEIITPKQISMTELQNKINQQSIEIDNLNKEINRLRNEMMNLIQSVK